jgi:hypothetical protein
MKTDLAQAAYDVPDYGSSPTTLVLGGLSAARALYDLTVFSPHLSLMNWRGTGITESCCLTCSGTRRQFWEGMQS